MKLLSSIVNLLIPYYGCFLGFYCAYRLGSIGFKSKVQLLIRLVMALVATAIPVAFFILKPIVIFKIFQQLNTKYFLSLIIVNAVIALYILILNFTKRSKTTETVFFRIVNLIVSSLVLLNALAGLFPVNFYYSQFQISIIMFVTLLLYVVFHPIKEENGHNRIFISYRRKDSADVTGRIVDRLITKFGSDSILRDVDSIPLGVNFYTHIDKLLQSSSVCLVIIGKQWLSLCNSMLDKKETTMDFVRIEIELALLHHLPIIPVLLQNCTIPAVNQLPKVIKKLSFQNGISIRPDPDFNMDIQRLIHGIKAGIRKSKKMRKIPGYKKMINSNTKLATRTMSKPVTKSVSKITSKAAAK